MNNEICLTSEEKHEIILQAVASAMWDFYDGGNTMSYTPKDIRAAAYAVEYAQQAIMDKLEKDPDAPEKISFINIGGKKYLVLDGDIYIVKP